MNDARVALAPDLEIPRVITGLWQIADMERDGRTLDKDVAARAMQAYASAGLTAFDMADHYGSAEDIAGLFSTRYAGDADVRMLTKWVPEPGGSSKGTVRAAVERALRRLKTERLDLLQYHAWNYADPAYLDDLFCLDELRREGLIRHLGLTNFDTAHLRIVLASGIDVVSNQVSYSLLDQRARGDMTDLCSEAGVKLLAFGTLAGGFLTERWLDQPEPSPESLRSWSQMKYKRYIDATGGWTRFQQLLGTLKRVSERHGVSMANIASSYILNQPAVGAVIVGARLGERDHIDDTLRLMDFSLPAEDEAAIGEAIGELDHIAGDCGDEYRRPPYLTASGDLSDHLAAIPKPYASERGQDGRTRASSGTVWEGIAGFSRAVRTGDRVVVSGTTATHGERRIGGADPEAQADFVIDKISGALQSLDASLEDVVRTRVFVNDIDDWEPVCRAHGRRFGHIRPANTLVAAKLVGEGYLVEIEAEAIVRR